MSFAYRPDFFDTFAASFETLKDGGIYITVDDDGASASTNLTRQEVQALHDLLAKHIAGTAKQTPQVGQGAERIETSKLTKVDMSAGDRVVTSDGEGVILRISSYGYAHVMFDDGQVRKYPVRLLRAIA